MKRTSIHILMGGALLCSLALSAGCATIADMTAREDVKPWEREVLAREDMQIPADPMHTLSDEHIYFSKEASTGGNGVGGGGCGCN